MKRIRRSLALTRTNLHQELDLHWIRSRFRQGDWRFMLEKASNYCVGVVLSYHRVNRFPREGFCPTRGLTVDTDDFEAHLAFLKEYFAVIPLAQLVEGLHGAAALPENFVVLTFDDGYEDNFTDVFPLLTKYGVPATVFVTVGLVGQTEPLWHDWLETLLGRTAKDRVSWPDPKQSVQLPLRSMGERWYAYEWMSERLARRPIAERTGLLTALGQSLGEPVPPQPAPQQRMVTWAQLREMQAGGLVEIGSHSMRHQVLATMDEAHADQEIGESRRRIQAEIGGDARLFAYPNGTFHDFSQLNVEQLQTYGFHGACTQEPGLVTKRSDPFRLPRVDAAGMPLEGLVMGIAGLIQRCATEIVKSS